MVSPGSVFHLTSSIAFVCFLFFLSLFFGWFRSSVCWVGLFFFFLFFYLLSLFFSNFYFLLLVDFLYILLSNLCDSFATDIYIYFFLVCLTLFFLSLYSVLSSLFSSMFFYFIFLILFFSLISFALFFSFFPFASRIPGMDWLCSIRDFCQV